ncbi:MAG: YihY/virulence factor BrkB family protein [Halobacteria archaeon]|nr:YihY/virulence factor BrkB family protein [Halobacteria archaeon]
MSAPEKLLDVARRVVSSARENELSFLAAAVAYYAIVALFPLTLVLITVVAFVTGDTASDVVLTAVNRYLSPTVSSVLATALEPAQDRGGGAVSIGTTAVGSVVLVWSASRLFRGLEVAFGRIYATSSGEGTLERLSKALTAFVALVFAAVAVALGGSYLSGYIASLPFSTHVRFLSTVVFLSGVLLPLYYVLPNADISLPEALPGALLASLSVSLLRFGFEIYATHVASYGVYGVVGAFLLFSTWLYLAGVSLLVGASLNATLNRTRSN